VEKERKFKVECSRCKKKWITPRIWGKGIAITAMRRYVMRLPLNQIFCQPSRAL